MVVRQQTARRNLRHGLLCAAAMVFPAQALAGDENDFPPLFDVVSAKPEPVADATVDVSSIQDVAPPTTQNEPSLLAVTEMAAAEQAPIEDASEVPDEGIEVAHSVAQGEGPSDRGVPVGFTETPSEGPEEIFLLVPESALQDGPCPTAMDGYEMHAVTRREFLPNQPMEDSRIANAVCFGSGWKLSRGDGIHEPKFDLSFTPEQSLCEDGTCTGRQFSSRVQVGLDSQTSTENGGKGWFLFAGADDKAVLWRPMSQNNSSAEQTLMLNDSVTVGDVEAGLSLIGERSELSVSYIHRETSYRVSQEQKLTDTEGFVGVVLRIK